MNNYCTLGTDLGVKITEVSKATWVPAFLD